jgi:beta-glucosidase
MTDIGHLIDQMTLEEKVALLAGADLWHTVPVGRLGVPALRVTDGPNGARGAFGNLESTSVCTPVGIALGATWNPDLVEKVGEILGEETKTKGAHILLAPTVNMPRSPISGRNFECFSEDPFLSGEIAAAYINGVQSQGVGACIKHYACNDQEFERFTISAEVQERPLHEIYLEPFRRAILAAKPWGVMSAYNRINGVYAAENDYLLKNVLREGWDFEGVIISDWYGTYTENTPSGELDLEMPGPARWMDMKYVKAAIEDGRITEKDIDAKVNRLLHTIERAGLFENPELQPDRSVDKLEHRVLIRETAQEAIVLLKNEKILPLDTENVNSIAVIGENALHSQVLGGGSSAVAAHYLVSPLDGIRERAGDKIEVSYAPGCFIHKGLPAPAPDLLSTEDGSLGLQLEFFDNLDLSGQPAYSLISKRVQFGWFDNCVPKVSQDRFSVRLSGYFTPKVKGLHTFGMNMVGRGRLFVNGEKLIDTWEILNPNGQQTVQIEMAADQSYSLRVEYKWEGDPKWRSLALGHLPPHAEDLMAEAVELAARSDLVIVIAGLTSEWESESFDRVDMRLPGNQNELIEKIAEANQNVIVALNCGSPVEMPWLDQIPAVLQLWYNSQEQGNALADVLFGDVSPSGKLPISFPKRLEQNPTIINFPGDNGKVHYGEGLFVGYRYYDKKAMEPLFPFGHGLSYTEFEYSNLRIHDEEFRVNDGLRISLNVRNIGSCNGKEVVQVYVRDLQPRLTRPEKELKAFAKVYLEPGETKSVNFSLDHEAFWLYDPKEKGWVVEPGEFEILIGASSRDIRLSKQVKIAKEN